jgi:hypothetical protein
MRRVARKGSTVPRYKRCYTPPVTQGSSDSKRGIEIVAERPPIVEIRIHPGFTVEDIDVAYDELEDIARRGAPHIHWTDLREVQPLSFTTEIRKRFAERERRMFEFGNECIDADVRIVEERMVRGVLAAFEWLTGSAPWPVRNLRSDVEAMAWLRSLGAISGG